VLHLFGDYSEAVGKDMTTIVADFFYHVLVWIAEFALEVLYYSYISGGGGRGMRE
jgi:hypothetical protein